MDNRRIIFEGIQNVRDLGGLPTTDGHTIAAGRLNMRHTCQSRFLTRG